MNSPFFQLVEAPSLSEGLRQLEFDNKTESVNTINILHRWDSQQSSFTHISNFHPTVRPFRLSSETAAAEVQNFLYTGSTSTKRLCLPDSTTSTPSGWLPFSSTPTPSSPFRFLSPVLALFRSRQILFYILFLQGVFLSALYLIR